MTAFRFFLIIVVFLVAAVGWMILGATIEYRTRNLTQRLGAEVDALWGPTDVVQPVPTQFSRSVYTKNGKEYVSWSNPADPLASEIDVRFIHDHRYKGLIWFSTYTVAFSGTYTVSCRGDGATPERFEFSLPDRVSAFENLSVSLDAQPLALADVKQGNTLIIPLPADTQPHTVALAYRTQGRDRWLYDLGRGGETATMVRQFTLTATTDFQDIDYPKGSISPTPAPATLTDTGAQAVWTFENRTTREKLGIEMPQRQNAGAVAGRMAFSAPVGLFFFFTVLFTVVILKRVTLHPMHYLFISAGFFAFHILMAYLVDRISLDYAFWICAAVSVFLVISYMRLVTGARFAILYVGLAQLVYLVGFSYAFTWEGNTGLTITIAAIATLLVLMQSTGRLDWSQVFHRASAPTPPARRAPVAPAAGSPAPATPPSDETTG